MQEHGEEGEGSSRISFHGESRQGGSLMVGDKGVLYSPDDYGGDLQAVPQGKFEGYKPPRRPSLPRNGHGDDGMKEEWVRAIMENKPEIAYSNFDFAGLLTEANTN